MLTLKSARRALLVVTAIGLCGVSVAGAPVPSARATEALAPELSGLGTLHVPVSTALSQAQRFFNQDQRFVDLWSIPTCAILFLEHNQIVVFIKPRFAS